MQVEKTQYGYFTLANKPTKDELAQYYSNKYYQDATGSYEQSYRDSELAYFNNKIAQKFYIINEELGIQNAPALLDIGCGEGWALQFFKNAGWTVTGLDYSSFACEKFNPDCLPDFIVGDIYLNLQNCIKTEEKYDVIWLDNVLEHVLEPEHLIIQLKKLIKAKGILVIEVPNDFSIIQQYALDKGYIEKEFWVTVPDHVSYFNREGLQNLMCSNGWSDIKMIADYPIDWNLLNSDSNYIMDRTKGKNCHTERIEFENLIHLHPVYQVVKFYESMCTLGLGRQITGFFKLEN